MRLARVKGKLTLSRRLPELPTGALLICEALDANAVKQLDNDVPRQAAMPESLIVLDELGAGEGALIAVSEGREASMPWWPAHAPVDAYCVGLIDNVNVKSELMSD